MRKLDEITKILVLSGEYDLAVVGRNHRGARGGRPVDAKIHGRLVRLGISPRSVLGGDDALHGGDHAADGAAAAIARDAFELGASLWLEGIALDVAGAALDAHKQDPAQPRAAI